MSHKCQNQPRQNNIFFGNTVRASSKLVSNKLETLKGDVCISVKEITTGIKTVSNITELRKVLADNPPGGSCILLESGNYILTEPLVIPNFITLMGCNRASVVFLLSADFDTSLTPITLQGSTITLKDLTINGSLISLSNNCLVTVVSSLNITFSNVSFLNAGVGVAALCLLFTNDIQIEKCEFSGNPIGITVVNEVLRLHVTECTFSAGASDIGVQILNIAGQNKNIDIVNCILTNSDIQGESVDQCEVSNCTLINSNVDMTTSTKITISDSVFMDVTKNAIDINNSSGISIVGNTIKGQNSLYSIRLATCLDSVIGDNNVGDLSTSGILITNNSANITVYGNAVDVTNGPGMYVDTSSNINIMNNNFLVSPLGVTPSAFIIDGTTRAITLIGNQLNGVSAIDILETPESALMSKNIFGDDTVTPIVFPNQLVTKENVSIQKNLRVLPLQVVTLATGTPQPFGLSSNSQFDMNNAGAPNNFIQIEPLNLGFTGHQLLLRAADVDGGTITVEFNGAIFSDGTTIDFTADGATALLTWVGTQWTTFGTSGLSAAGVAIIP